MDCHLLRPLSPSHRYFFSPVSRASGCIVRGHCSNFRAYKKTNGDNIQRLNGCFMDPQTKCGNQNAVQHRRFHQCIPLNASSGHPLESEPEIYESKSPWRSMLASLNALYKFSRPHTVIGTAMGIISVSLLAVETMSDFSPLFFTGMMEAVVAALFMNIYIVGLNQLFDIEIDKVNKPYLPLASGEYSVRTGIAVVLASAIMSFGIGWVVGSWPLFWALFISFILGTAYSINLPLLRWKRFAVVAAICILAVRAVIVQLAFFLHIQTFVFRRPVILSRPLIFATAFMSFFSVVIALFKLPPNPALFTLSKKLYTLEMLYILACIRRCKIVKHSIFFFLIQDIPDIDGDRIFGIRSFSVRLGQQKVFWICIYLLEVAYAVAMVIGGTSSCLWSKCVTVMGHAILASALWNHARSLDLKSKAAITSFYMFIWKLFYAEYLLIPLVR